jgi:hypothetical protein
VAISVFGTASAPVALSPRVVVQDLTPETEFVLEATAELVTLGVLTVAEALDMAQSILDDLPG